MTMRRGWEKAVAWVDAVERTVLAVLMTAMVVLAALQIILRIFFQSGILWAPSVLGASVLWITMLGALAATGSERHIKIDVLSHALPPRARGVITAVAQLFAALICGLLAAATLRYVGFMKEMEDVAFLGVPSWIVQVVMPVVFGLMALRFAVHAGMHFADAWKGVREP